MTDLKQKYDDLQTKQQVLFHKSAEHFALYSDYELKARKVTTELSLLEEQMDDTEDNEMVQLDLFKENEWTSFWYTDLR